MLLFFAALLFVKMFLQVFAPCLWLPIHFLVSADGIYFFKAIDIAKLVENLHPYKFCRKYSNLLVKDVVYKRVPLPAHTAKTWILSLEQVLDILKAFRLSGPKPEEFQEMFTDPDAKIRIDTKLKLSTKMKEAPVIEIVYNTNDTISAVKFFKDFVTWTLQFYENLANEIEMSMEETTMEEEEPEILMNEPETKKEPEVITIEEDSFDCTVNFTLKENSIPVKLQLFMGNNGISYTYNLTRM